MRHDAQVHVLGGNDLGNPAPAGTLSPTVLKCAMRAKSGIEEDDEDAGLYSVTTYEVTFWKADADENGIRPGAVIRVDGVDMRVATVRPGGIGLTQYLHCACEHAEDV